MKLKPIAYAIIAAGLVGPTFAAYSGHPVAHHKSTCGMASSMSSIESIIAGNGYNSGVDSAVCWQDRVRFSGTVDAAYRNVRGDVSGSDTTTRAFDLNQAILGVNAKLNSAWSAKGVFRWGFSQTPVDNFAFHTHADLIDGWNVEEASLTYSDSSRSPLFFKLGRGFVPFGHYADPFEFLPTVAQTFSQLNEDFVQLGVASSAGWNASVAGWTSAVSANDWRYVATVGFDHSMRGVGMHFDASYLSAFEETVGNANLSHSAVALVGTNTHSAWQAGVSTNLRGFDLGARYLRASGLDASDDSRNAWGAHVGYGLNAMGHSHKVGFDYESLSDDFSSEVSSRWSADWTVGVADNVDARLKYASYSTRTATTTLAAAPRVWLFSVTGKF